MFEKILAGLRVPGGFHVRATQTLAVALIVAACMFAGAALADDLPPRMLIAANTDAWQFDILVSAGSAPLDHDFSLCGVTSAARVQLPARGAMILRDPVVCVHGFALLPAPDEPAVAESIVTFGDGVTSASFTVPPIGALLGNEASVLDRPLVSDDREGIWINVFPEYESTPIYLILWNARDLAADPVMEKFRASPPVGQYQVQAKGVFLVDVYLGTDPLYRCFPAPSCDVFGAVYGFASNGTPSGGSMRVAVFGE